MNRDWILKFLSSDLDSLALNRRRENFSELTMEQQAALMQAYINYQQASAMQFLPQRMFAPPLMFSPPLVPNWSMPPHLAFNPALSPNSFMLATRDVEIAENYSSAKCESAQIKVSNVSPSSDTPSSPMNDSVEMKQQFVTKDGRRSRVFECKICNKKFGYKHVLQNHEKTHTGEKSFHCTICSKPFRRDHHLKVHMRLHSGEKPYVCLFPLCGKQFVQVANLRRHQKIHENGNVIKIHETFLKSEDTLSTKSFASESSEESLDLRKHTEVKKIGFMPYSSSEELMFDSPEQSEPEDLSTKHCGRSKAKLDWNLDAIVIY